MGQIRSFAVAALIVAATTVPAVAADAIRYPMGSGAEQVPLYDSAAAFDWNGFYGGVYGVARNTPLTGDQLGLGVELGANAQIDFFLVGGEVSLQGLTGVVADTAYGQVTGRAGVLITDSVLLYAAAGYGVDLGLPQSDALLGGGVEVAVSDNMSFDAEYLHGFPITGGNPKDQITLGARFHF